jgi:hypothetical protein
VIVAPFEYAVSFPVTPEAMLALVGRKTPAESPAITQPGTGVGSTQPPAVATVLSMYEPTLSVPPVVQAVVFESDVTDSKLGFVIVMDAAEALPLNSRTAKMVKIADFIVFPFLESPPRAHMWTAPPQDRATIARPRLPISCDVPWMRPPVNDASECKSRLLH